MKTLKLCGYILLGYMIGVVLRNYMRGDLDTKVSPPKDINKWKIN